MQTSKRTILVVDDNDINRMILSEMLSPEFEIIEACDGKEAMDIMHNHYSEITIVLLDLVMPVMNGFEVLAAMSYLHYTDEIPVIMITADVSAPSMQKAFDLGAVDFITRPFDQAILRRRVQNTIMLYARQKSLIDTVVEQISDRDKESKLMVAILSHIVEFRNGESGRHVQNINVITELLLKALLGQTDKYNVISGDIEEIKLASSLHDIGKIRIPDEILNKPGKLTPGEFEIMKTHSALGADMMRSLRTYQSEKLVQYAFEICRWHHERYDGKGYPDGLKGDEIPISAQIVSLADVYDALTSERVYKQAYTHEEAMHMIRNGECGAFNPLLMNCLETIGPLLQGQLEAEYKLETLNKDELKANILSALNK